MFLVKWGGVLGATINSNSQSAVFGVGGVIGGCMGFVKQGRPCFCAPLFYVAEAVDLTVIRDARSWVLCSVFGPAAFGVEEAIDWLIVSGCLRSGMPDSECFVFVRR